MNVSLICPQHKCQIMQACMDLECQLFPFMCKDCLTDKGQHIKHNLIPYQQYITLVSKQIEENVHEQTKFIDLFNQESQIVQQLLLSDEHLNNVEGFIRSQKELIEQDIRQAIETLTFTFQNHKNDILNRLDQYLKIYKSNFQTLKEIVEPIHFLMTKCKYYANENNLKLKLHTKPDLGSQVKVSIKQMQTLKKPDILKQAFEKFKKSQEFNYNNSYFNTLLDKAVNSIKDFYIQNVYVPNTEQIEIIPPIIIQQPIQKQEPILTPTIVSPPIKSKSLEISYAERLTMLDDNKTVISAVESKVSQPSTPQINVQILDNRIIEDNNKNHLNAKFRIKKKLTIDFQVSSLALVSNTYVALGLADGTVKLLDMTTSKVSFYPNTYIQHTKPVTQLIVLKQNKGTRLSSLSDENYAIIWTLGENFVPYPERKLIGFKSKLNRIMDLADSSHLLCQSENNLQIINYHDNRIAYSFEFKTTLVEFLYVSKYEKFATISQGNLVSIYSLKMSSNLQGAMLLVNCELDCIQPAIAIPNISTCIATEFLQDIVICYGCVDGSVKLFNVLKNTLLGEYQLFNQRIKELIIVKQQKLFVLVVLAENNKQIKALIVSESKILQIEKYGELLEFPAKCGKNVLQTCYRNRSAIYLLSESQKDIGLYELC